MYEVVWESLECCMWWCWCAVMVLMWWYGRAWSVACGSVGGVVLLCGDGMNVVVLESLECCMWWCWCAVMV